MITKAFLDLLENHSGKELIFEYDQNKFVPNAYHITEIKNVHVESVDCGGYAHDFDQTVVQLWVDNVETSDRAMSAEKAKKIFDIVDNVKPINITAPIFFEWGNTDLKTSQYDVTEVVEAADKVTIKLSVPAVQCKPKSLKLENANAVVATEGGCCSPGGGCC